MSEFDPSSIKQFVYRSFAFDARQGHLELNYALVGDGQEIPFTEEVSLPGTEREGPVKVVAERLARLLFLAAGVSYYKAAVPPAIVVEVPVTDIERDFLAAVLRGGLTEFAYINNLPQALTPEIVVQQTVEPEPVQLPRRNESQPLVAVGGGKDSVVTIEALRAAGYESLLFSVNSYEPIQKTVDRAALPYTQAGRHLSPRLLTLNEQGAYNGHVPVTTIVSLIALMVAVMTGRSSAVFSNERSASVGNFMWEGIEVNHQWSKSILFERLLQDTLRQVVSPDVQYFSLLRPYSELRIARQFAKLKQYHDVFTSCNRAFHLDESKRQLWCGHCDKCRFVFLILAPYMSRDALMKIYGKDMLDDATQLAGFRALLGVEGNKPLECVGEVAECRLALMLMAQKDEWQGSTLVPILRADLSPEAMPDAEQQAEIFATGEHAVPTEYQKALEFIG